MCLLQPFPSAVVWESPALHSGTLYRKAELHAVKNVAEAWQPCLKALVLPKPGRMCLGTSVREGWSHVRTEGCACRVRPSVLACSS